MFDYCLSRVRLTVVLMVAACAAGNGFADRISREDAVRTALERNPEITAARKEWESASARLTQARAFPDPEFELEYEGLPRGFSYGEFGERNIGVIQSIEFPWKWWLRNKAAGRHAEAVREAVFEMKKLEIGTRVKTAYDRVLLGRKLLEYAEENLRLARDFLEKAEVRFEAGDVSRLEVLRAEAEVGRAENRVTIARNELSVPKAELNTLLAREIRAPFDVTGELTFRPVEVDLELLKKVALERRPDLRGIGMSYEESRVRRSVAVSSVIPDFNLGVFRQTVKEPAGRDSFWHVSFGLEIPVWAVFRRRGEIMEADAGMERARAEVDALRNRVLLEVESAFLDLKAAEAQVRLFREKTLGAAEKAYEMAARSYREGKATYLELLEAQRSLTETRMEYARALFDFNSALTALERAVGGRFPE